MGLVGAVWAGELLGSWPMGAPAPGEAAPLHLVYVEEGVPVALPGAVELSGGQVLVGAEVAQGRWEGRILAPAGPFSARVGSASLGLAPRKVEASGLKLKVRGEGEGRLILVEIRAGRPFEPGDLDLVVGEGEVRSLRQEGEAVVLAWDPGTVVFPHTVALAVRDRRYPEERVAVAHLAVRSWVRIPVTTTSGAAVTLRLGGRQTGPVTAGSDGVAALQVEVLPGDDRAEVLVVDPAGNKQRSIISLGGAVSPSLLVVGPVATLAGGRSRMAELVAARADGAPLRGMTPTCTCGEDATLALVEDGPGRWHVAGAALEVCAEEGKLRCVLGGQVAGAATLPTPSRPPSSIELRVDPPELDAAAPEALVYAALTGAEGQPLPTDGLVLSAERGAIGIVREGSRLVGRYQGGAAVGAGGDTIEARWARPVGLPGTPVALELGADWTGPFPQLYAQAVSATGAALAGVPLTVSVDDSEVIVPTDAQGWLRLPLPLPASGPRRVGVRWAGLGGELSLLRGERLGVSPERPVRRTTVAVPVVAGKVAAVRFGATPAQVVGGGPGRVLLTLDLRDRAGASIVDEGVTIEASAGEVGPLKRGEDGALQATLVVPATTPPGPVQVRARSAQGRFAETTTVVEVLAPPQRAGIGLRLGYISGLGGVSSPFAAVEGELRLRPPVGELYGRLWVGAYAESAAARDPSSLEAVRLRLDLLPVGLGLVARRQGPRLASWAGASAVVMPYRVEATFGSAGSAQGWGLSGPGLGVHAGVGRPIGGGMVGLQLSELLIGMRAEDIGWSGAVGGVELGLGYRQSL